jgi:hypothetical protein
MILLKAAVARGQRLTLINLVTKEKISGIAIAVNPGVEGFLEIAVECEAPNARFWGVSFPLAGWTSHNPDAKQYIPGTKVSERPRKRALSSC